MINNNNINSNLLSFIKIKAIRKFIFDQFIFFKDQTIVKSLTEFVEWVVIKAPFFFSVFVQANIEVDAAKRGK